MANFIVAAVLIAVVVLAAAYMIRAKKRGDGCIGCSCSKGCNGNCGGCSHK